MSPAARARLLGLLAAFAVLAMHGGASPAHASAPGPHPQAMVGHQHVVGAPAPGHPSHPASMVMGHADCTATQSATSLGLAAPSTAVADTAAVHRTPTSWPPGTARRAPPDLHRLCVSRT